MEKDEIEAYRKKLKDKTFMQKSIVDIGGRMADEYIKSFNKEEIELRKKNKQGASKMKNSLTDLNNYLFEQLERLLDDEICSDEESTKREIAKARAITDVANSITNNATVQLNAMRFRAKLGLGKEEMPQMLLEK